MFQPVSGVWPAPYAEGLSTPRIGPLLMNLPLAVGLLDSSGRITSGNDALRATAGAGWRLGMRPEAMLVADDAELLTRAVADVLAGGEAHTLRLALADRPDEVRDIHVIPTPTNLGGPAIIAMRDIREQIRLENQVAAVNRLQAVGQLAGGIAHDFNNLLLAIQGNAEQLQDRVEPGADADAVAEILRNGRRGADLVAQLLAFARQQPQRRQLLCVSDLVNDLRPLLVKLLGPAIDLAIAAPKGRFAVRADAGQMEQVIVNLAVNARDAMDGQGSLLIRIADVPRRNVAALGHEMMPAIDFVAIDVTDTGSGIPSDIVPKIFEPFFSTKPQGQGTGLGLSTVYGIVKQSDGYIFAKAGPGGRGTTFSVYLPGRPRAAAPAPVQSLPKRAAAALPSGRTVLLVEDEPSVRAVFARGLERKGCVVTSAGDAMAALAILRDGAAFDVLVSDVMMPGIDGVELAFEASRLRPEMGIVLMSGYAELPRHRDAVALGIRFLAKPFALADLVAAIADARPPTP
ncbi:MAG: response regulator [Sphingomonadales bacterium]